MKKHLTYKADIKRLLKLSDETYNNNVLEFSYSFLEHKNYPKPIIEFLHQTPAYWIWWRNQFAIADMMYLNLHGVFDYGSYPRNFQIDMYKSCHVGIQAYPGRLIEKINHLQTIKN